MLALQNHEEGEVCYCDDVEKGYIFQDGEWHEAVVSSKGVEMTLHDINKSIIGQLPAYNKHDLKKAKQTIQKWQVQNNGEFYLLYGKEISYFTLFKKDIVEDSFSDVVMEIVTELGPIHTIEETDHGIEFWIKVDDELIYFQLFNYDMGIVTYGS